MAGKITIMVAVHTDCALPNDIGYLPVHVGKALSSKNLGLQRDDVGDNISDMNKSFCELTGLYWLWKNHDSDYLGLVHYRRYFKPLDSLNVTVNNKAIAASNDLISVMEGVDVILPKKRCYVIDTIRTHYKYSHNGADLDALGLILSQLYPDYLEAYNRVFSCRCLSLFNIFVMREPLFNEYSEWLFEILFELEKRIPYQNYGPYQERVFGFLAERLLNVWVEHHKKSITIKFLPVVTIGGENLFFKVMGLLKRKFLAQKLK